MKFLVLFLSLLTLVTLSVDVLHTSDNTNANSVKNSDKSIGSVIPKKLPKELLSAEVKWQALLQGRETGNNEPKTTKSALKNALMIGGKNYELFGIFNDEQLLFVLLKNEGNEMVKLTLGDELPGEFTLAEINNNTIVFVNNNGRVEYKLFEQKKHVKN